MAFSIDLSVIYRSRIGIDRIIAALAMPHWLGPPGDRRMANSAQRIACCGKPPVPLFAAARYSPFAGRFPRTNAED
jgi:hypothetical protein